MTSDRPRGIAGLEGREPIGAVLRIGTKGPKGYPVDRDRFYIVEPYQNDKEIRPLHPRFGEFNTQIAQHRKLVRAQLMHTTQREAFEFYLRAQVGPNRGGNPTNRAPWCEGDGRVARRYFGLTGSGEEPEEDWREVPCPHDRCEYRQRVRGKVACAPFARFLFRPVWSSDKLPSMLTKLTTRSWNTTAHILGMFEQVSKAATVLGLEDYSLMGFPFSLLLTEKTGSLAGKKTKYPVVVATPEVDPITFFLAQQSQRDRLLGERKPLAITDTSQQAAEIEAADFEDVTPGTHSDPYGGGS